MRKNKIIRSLKYSENCIQSICKQMSNEYQLCARFNIGCSRFRRIENRHNSCPQGIFGPGSGGRDGICWF